MHECRSPYFHQFSWQHTGSLTHQVREEHNEGIPNFFNAPCTLKTQKQLLQLKKPSCLHLMFGFHALALSLSTLQEPGVFHLCPLRRFLGKDLAIILYKVYPLLWNVYLPVHLFIYSSIQQRFDSLRCK